MATQRRKTTTKRTNARKTSTPKKTQKVRITITVESNLLTPAQARAVKAKMQAKYKGKPGYKVSVVNARRR